MASDRDRDTLDFDVTVRSTEREIRLACRFRNRSTCQASSSRRSFSPQIVTVLFCLSAFGYSWFSHEILLVPVDAVDNSIA